jgi:Gpi18-like mannosyltransferase
MQVLVFSTSVKSMEEVNVLKPLIDSLVGKNNWNFALDDVTTFYAS